MSNSEYWRRLTPPEKKEALESLLTVLLDVEDYSLELSIQMCQDILGCSHLDVVKALKAAADNDGRAI